MTVYYNRVLYRSLKRGSKNDKLIILQAVSEKENSQSINKKIEFWCDHMVTHKANGCITMSVKIYIKGSAYLGFTRQCISSNWK